jgi:hypothetical protein
MSLSHSGPSSYVTSSAEFDEMLEALSCTNYVLGPARFAQRGRFSDTDVIRVAQTLEWAGYRNDQRLEKQK